MKTSISVLFLFALICLQGKAQTFPYLTPHLPDSAYTARKIKSLSEPSVFQKEIDGKLPERIFYQDSLVTVLHSFNSQMPVHLLIVPNRRIPTMNDAVESDANLLGHMLLVAAKVAKQAGIAETGYRLAFNTNEDAGQSAFHLHLHVLGGTKTGPMVDPGWRNIQRRLADTAQVTPLEKRVLGNWEAKQNNADGSFSNLTMKWESDLQNRFLQLTYRAEKHGTGNKTEIFEGKTFHQPTGVAGKYNSIWMDSNGLIHPVEAIYDGQTLVTYWALETGNEKTVYRFVDENAIEIVDFQKVNGELQAISQRLFKRRP